MAGFAELTRLDGRHAVVTGAAMGLGACIAQWLAGQGARVSLVDIDAKRVAARAAQLDADGAHAHGIACDVADEKQVVAAFEQARVQAGSIDILANCAGVASPPGMPFTNNSEADFDRTLAVNVKAMFFTAKACHDDLVASKHGRIVNLSSITGVISAAYMPAYTVSKAAVISLTKVMARDLAMHGVSANAVCPGFIWTPLWEDLGKVMACSPEERATEADARRVFDERIDKHVPMRRAQSAEDVAALVAFLSSDAAANITGQVIGVDGGVTI